MSVKYMIICNLIDLWNICLVIGLIYILFKMISNIEYFFERRIKNIYMHKSLIFLYIIVISTLSVYDTTIKKAVSIILIFILFVIASFIFYKEIGLKKWTITLSLISKIITFYTFSYIIIFICNYFNIINNFFNLLIFSMNQTYNLQSHIQIKSLFNLSDIIQNSATSLFIIIYFIIYKYFKDKIFIYMKLFYDNYGYKMFITSSINVLLYTCIEFFLKNRFEYKISIFFLVLIYSEYSFSVMNTLKSEVQILQYKDNVYVENEKFKKEQEMKLKIIKHDLKNHLIVLNDYLQNNNNEDAIAYLNRISGIVENTSDIVYCSNSIINTLIASKSNQIKKYNIKLNIDINVNDDISVTCC